MPVLRENRITIYNPFRFLVRLEHQKLSNLSIIVAFKNTFIMQLTSSVIAALGFAITAAADVICFPQPSQNITLPQSILDLDTSVKLNWANTLCNQLTFPADGVETALTPLEDGIEAPEDGHIYGVELVSSDNKSRGSP